MKWGLSACWNMAAGLPFDGRDDDNGAADFMQVQTGSPRAPNAP
jgi:hypothetical protein